MNSDLHLFEAEINSYIREYFNYAGLEKSAYALYLECREKGKTIPSEKNIPADGSKLSAQNNILNEFDSGSHNHFWDLWNENVPLEIRSNDHTCQRLEFYIQIHFAVFPIRLGDSMTQTPEETMARFKYYLETKGAGLSQTTEFLPYYALPFVPNPTKHPSFKDLFSPNWIPDLRARVERFLSAALSAADPPIIIKLIKNKDKIESSLPSGENSPTKLHQVIVQAEKRSAVYSRRFNLLQADYHILIGIAAELVDSLEQTVHGKMVTVEYLQNVIARLFNTKGGGQPNLSSIDFTRPGTASSLIRQSMARENYPEPKQEVVLLPSLDFDKIKSDLMVSFDNTKSLLLQALRWRLTRSVPGEQRDTVVHSFIQNDLLSCDPNTQDAAYKPLRLLTSPDVTVRQYTARLFNAFASLQLGRTYLSGNPHGVMELQHCLQQMNGTTDKMTREHLLGCLQKLSLRRALQSVMIEGGLIAWLISILDDSESLSDYMLEYAVALLMNLCLRSAGKRKCGEIPSDVLKVLSYLLGHQNVEIRPYVNGALYSVLSNEKVKEVAQQINLEDTLRGFMENESPEYRRQLEFIIKQLNGRNEAADIPTEDSDDEGDEDDDEDQDAMEADLDKDEILDVNGNELSGEHLLYTEYLGLMSNTNNNSNVPNPAARSLVIDSGIMMRPTTPSYQRIQAQSEVIDHSQIFQLNADGNNRADSLDLKSSFASTLIGDSQSYPVTMTSRSRPPTSAGSRPSSRQQTLDSTKSRIKSPVKASPYSSVDEEGSRIVKQATGLNRQLVPTTQRSLALPAKVPVTDGIELKEYTSAFGSRPRILRTPDVGNGVKAPPNPTFSKTEPRSRPSSASSWRGSKSSSNQSKH